MAKLFVICGHGAGDSGACAGGRTEAALVRKLADRMRSIGGADVQVGDKSVNWYASDYISKGKCPKGVPVLELHMDSAGKGARGGHVIIKAGFKADAQDRALAKFISGFFPGRAKSIVGRSDLANPNRAARKGVNYRLLECCFISDAGDRKKFESQMDELARGILRCFGIGAAPKPAPATPDQSSIEAAIAKARAYAKDDSHGYELAYHSAAQMKTGTDCSGLARYYAAAVEGAALDSYPDFSTRTMRGILAKRGWQVLKFDIKKARRGDLLLTNRKSHVVLYLGNKRILGAEGDWDGRRGDSSGNEVTERGYYDYQYDYIIRPEDDMTVEQLLSAKVDGKSIRDIIGNLSHYKGWDYKNERIEEDDAYQILRDIRAELRGLSERVAKLEG